MRLLASIARLAGPASQPWSGKRRIQSALAGSIIASRQGRSQAPSWT